MATAPNYAATPVNSASVIGPIANANRDGATGTYYTIFTASAAGGRVESVNLHAIAATTQGLVRFFVNNKLILEAPVAPVTPSGVVPAWSARFELDLDLEASAVLKCNTQNAESFHAVINRGGSY